MLQVALSDVNGAILVHEITVTEPAILIRIAQLYEPGMSADQLYEATRGVWKIGKRRESVRYALAVADGIVREVYEIHCWHPAASTNYTTRPIRSVKMPGRWEFTGDLAPPAIRAKYLGQSVAHYFAKGNANPIMYTDAYRAPH